MQGQEKEIPRKVRSLYEGIWQCNNKFQNSTIEIKFEPGKDYAVIKDAGNGIAPAKILYATLGKSGQFVIPAVQDYNDYTEMEVLDGKLYLRTKEITWDRTGNILLEGSLETKTFNRVSQNLNNQVSISKITRDEFDRQRKQTAPNKPIQKITDFKIVQEKLKGIVLFEELDGNLFIKKINFRNGNTTDGSYQLDECSFSAYFPSEDIILLECGHTTDRSFNLKTGEETYDVGNLNYVTTSPSGKYRLNKIFEGQECFNHFIQEKGNNSYKKILELNELFEKKTGKWLCVIEKEFWTDDHTLYFGLVTQYKDGGNEYEFYKVMITDNNN